MIQHKLTAALMHVKGEVIVEDTGLFIMGRDGLPGTLTKWFLKSIGNTGIYKLTQVFGTKAIAMTTIGFSNYGEPVFLLQK